MMTRKMMFEQGWKIVGMIVVIAGILGALQPVMAQEQVNFLLNWKISGYHAPLFLALERGYFTREEIVLSFSEGQGAAKTAKVIAEGTSYQFGIVDYGTMMKGVVRELPLKAIFGTMQTSPMCLISHASKPITHPEALEGKTVAGVSGSSILQILPALLAKNHVNADKVTVIQTAFGGEIPLLLQHRCDAIDGYVNGTLMTIQQQGVDPHVLLLADFGVNLLSNGIVVNRDYLRTHSDVVAGMVRAISQGWHDAQEDPEAAMDALLKRYPDHAEKRDLYLAQLEATFPLLQTPNTQGKPLGWMSEKDWEQTQEILFEYGGLEKKLPLETYYTNDYIPTAE